MRSHDRGCSVVVDIDEGNPVYMKRLVNGGPELGGSELGGSGPTGAWFLELTLLLIFICENSCFDR